MQILIDNKSGAPIYDQIYSQIKAQIDITTSEYDREKLMERLVEVVLSEINGMNSTNYRLDQVDFCFEPEVPTNALENAQIELTEAQRKQTEITTLLNLANHIDDETRLKLICEQLDVDYNEIKDKIPRSDDDTDTAQSILDGVVTDEPDGGGVIA